MKLAAEIELPFIEFWEMTPYELNLKAENYNRRKIERFKEEISLEYYNAMWTIQWLGKKKPDSLKTILDKIDKPAKKIMTDEQMLVQAKILNAVFGGIEK